MALDDGVRKEHAIIIFIITMQSVTAALKLTFFNACLINRTRLTDLILTFQKLLIFEPGRRLTAKEAMKHPYFNSVRGDCSPLTRLSLSPATTVTSSSSSASSSNGEENEYQDEERQQIN